MPCKLIRKLDLFVHGNHWMLFRTYIPTADLLRELVHDSPILIRHSRDVDLVVRFKYFLSSSEVSDDNNNMQSKQ